MQLGHPQLGVAFLFWALFKITLSNPAWAEHLKEGALIGTASYFD